MTATMEVGVNCIPSNCLVSSGQQIRFLPYVYDSSTSPVNSAWPYPISSWSWKVDGSQVATTATPIWTVSGVARHAAITCTATDCNSVQATSATFYLNVASSAPTFPTDGSYFKVAVLLYDSQGHSTLVTRAPVSGSGSHLCLQTPKTQDMMDKSGQASFSLLDTGNATATENALMGAGNNVIIFMGQTIVFSGVIQQSVLNTSNGFTTSTQVKLWDITCDNDLLKLQRNNVSSTALSSTGSVISDTPGNIARRVLAPASGVRDTRGIIGCVDYPIQYNLNSAVSEGVGNQYEHMVALQQATNYDLRTRADFFVFPYSAFSSGTFTIPNASFTTNEFVGTASMPMFIVVLPTTSQIGHCAYGTITSNASGTITSSSLQGTSNVNSTGTVIIYRGYLVDFAQDLMEPSAVQNFNVNQTIMDWAPNTNQRKLVTQVCAQGKNSQGTTISVQLSGVHAYDNVNQIYNETTYIDQLSEGYVYQNTYCGTQSAMATTTNPGYNYACTFFNGSANITTTSGIFSVGNWVQFNTTSSLPANIASYTDYYVSYSSGTTIQVSTDSGSASPIVASGAGSGCRINQFGTVTITCPSGTLTSGMPIFFAGLNYGNWCTGVAYVGAMTSGATTSVITVYSSPNSPGTRYVIAGTVSTNQYLFRMQDLINNNSTSTISPAIWLTGWNYCIPSGTVMELTAGGSGFGITTNGSTSQVTMNDGTLCTVVPITFSATSNPTIPLLDYGGMGFCMSSILWVQNKSRINTGGSILVGEEPISSGNITGSGTNSTYGDYITVNAASRIMSSSLKAYPHGIGCFVAQNDYSPTQSGAQSGSPIATYGLVIDNVTVDSNTTYGQLDTYASGILLGLGTFYLQSTADGPFNTVYIPYYGNYYEGATEVAYCCPPKTGQGISVTLYSGGTPTLIQVMEVDLDMDKNNVKLILGNYLKNVYTSLIQQTNGFNQTIS